MMLPQLNPGFTPMSFNVGYDIRATKPLAKKYALGIGLGVHSDAYAFEGSVTNDIDNVLGITTPYHSKSLSQADIDLEFFQRVTFMPGGALTHHGLHWDLGVWAGVRVNNTYMVKADNATNADMMIMSFYNVRYAGFGRMVFGATTRLTWDWIGVCASYRLSDLLLKSSDLKLPALRVGIMLEL